MIEGVQPIIDCTLGGLLLTVRRDEVRATHKKVVSKMLSKSISRIPVECLMGQKNMMSLHFHWKNVQSITSIL